MWIPLLQKIYFIVNKLYIGIRPEHIENADKGEEGDLEALVYVVEPLGAEYIINVMVEDTLIKIRTMRELILNPGDRVRLKINWKKATIFDPETGLSLGKFLISF